MSETSSNIKVDPDGDLIVKVVEYDEADGQRPVLKIAFMKVKRSVLEDNSTTWKKMLNAAGPWNESTSPLIELHEDTLTSLELWFRCIHNNMTEEMNDIPVHEIWNALEVCRKYFLEVEKLNGWFSSWWRSQDKQQMDIKEMKELLYPSHEFEHVDAFSYLTKRLAYEVKGHITELNPTHHGHLHLRHSIIQQINAAKGSMKTRLHRGLFEVIKKFLNQSCPCKEQALFEYCKGLDRTRVWPLEEWGTKKSINELIEGLQSFRYDAPAKGCSSCKYDIGSSVVRKTSIEVKNYFDGLCLCCMDSSIIAGRDIDADYWTHDSMEEWDVGCPFNHGQPTWYFSFMGRREHMDAHKRRERERKMRC